MSRKQRLAGRQIDSAPFLSDLPNPFLCHVIAARDGWRVSAAPPGLDRAATKIVNLPAADRSAGGGPGPHTLASPRQCPKCGEAALLRLEGCDQTTSCDYSKCR